MTEFRGLPEARNFGVQHTQYAYILFLDDDFFAISSPTCRSDPSIHRKPGREKELNIAYRFRIYPTEEQKILLDLVIKHLVVQKTTTAKCFSKEYLLFFCWIEPETICYVQFFFSPWVLGVGRGSFFMTYSK